MNTRSALRTLALVAFAGAIIVSNGDAGATGKTKSKTPPPPPPISQQALPAPSPWQPLYQPAWGMPQPQPMQQPRMEAPQRQASPPPAREAAPARRESKRDSDDSDRGVSRR